MDDVECMGMYKSDSNYWIEERMLVMVGKNIK